MSDFLLDVTFFEDLRSGDAGALSLVERILNGEVSAAVSPMTVFQVWQDPDLDRRTEIGFLSVLRFVEEAPLSIDAAKSAALNISGAQELGDDGATPDACNALVAATAVALGVPVCTRSPDPFERFGAETASYEDATRAYSK